MTAKCPHCDKPITLKKDSSPNGGQTVVRETVGRVKKEIMYSCPHCNKVLGFAFFLGGTLTGRP
jgi:endogenous inhibitor of DNA gyrase (YacG/DUF329 family)